MNEDITSVMHFPVNAPIDLIGLTGAYHSCAGLSSPAKGIKDPKT
jgi:hypothetical protein